MIGKEDFTLIMLLGFFALLEGLLFSSDRGIYNLHDQSLVLGLHLDTGQSSGMPHSLGRDLVHKEHKALDTE